MRHTQAKSMLYMQTGRSLESTVRVQARGNLHEDPRPEAHRPQGPCNYSNTTPSVRGLILCWLDLTTGGGGVLPAERCII